MHEYRRYVGRGKVLQTDLLPMIMHHAGEDELSDVLLRLLVNLTNPALLLYREELPKDGPGRRNYLELIEILQGYKQAFSLQPVWASLGKRLQTSLEVVCTQTDEIIILFTAVSKSKWYRRNFIEILYTVLLLSFFSDEYIFLL